MALQFHSCSESRNLKTVYVAPALRPLALREEDLENASGGVLSKDCGISGPVYYRAFLSVRSPHPTDTPTIIWAEGFGATMKAN